MYDIQAFLAKQLTDTDNRNKPVALGGSGSLIKDFFTPDQLKALLHFSCRVDIGDNNMKAEVLRAYLTPLGFDEVGTGTNRIAFLKDGMIVKVALDRRGHVDNFTEYKRSLELPEYLAKTYETNMIINIGQYVTLIDQSVFMAHSSRVKEVLSDISKAYLFNDLGCTLKNSMNWGTRNEDSKKDAELCILDYGYFYPLVGENTAELFRCAGCGGIMQWNSNFTGFICGGRPDNRGGCTMTATPSDIRNRMHLDFESTENKMLSAINATQVPDFRNYEKYIAELI